MRGIVSYLECQLQSEISTHTWSVNYTEKYSPIPRVPTTVRDIVSNLECQYSERYGLKSGVSTTVRDIVSHLECQLQWRIHSSLIPGVSTTVEDTQ